VPRARGRLQRRRESPADAAALPQAQPSGATVGQRDCRCAARRRSGHQRDPRSRTSTLIDDPEGFDYIIAHGVYSWVPAAVRDALLTLAARRLSRNGVLFVSYNVYPGCHVREAAWQMLHYHVDHLADPRAQLDAARAFAALLAEPGITQTETDAVIRQEFRKLAAQTDSALFHDDLALPNDPCTSNSPRSTGTTRIRREISKCSLNAIGAGAWTIRNSRFVDQSPAAALINVYTNRVY
jgi:hypothetical protein